MSLHSRGSHRLDDPFGSESFRAMCLKGFLIKSVPWEQLENTMNEDHSNDNLTGAEQSQNNTSRRDFLKKITRGVLGAGVFIGGVVGLPHTASACSGACDSGCNTGCNLGCNTPANGCNKQCFHNYCPSCNWGCNNCEGTGCNNGCNVCVNPCNGCIGCLTDCPREEIA